MERCTCPHSLPWLRCHMGTPTSLRQIHGLCLTFSCGNFYGVERNQPVPLFQKIPAGTFAGGAGALSRWRMCAATALHPAHPCSLSKRPQVSSEPWRRTAKGIAQGSRAKSQLRASGPGAEATEGVGARKTRSPSQPRPVISAADHRVPWGLAEEVVATAASLGTSRCPEWDRGAPPSRERGLCSGSGV